MGERGIWSQANLVLESCLCHSLIRLLNLFSVSVLIYKLGMMTVVTSQPVKGSNRKVFCEIPKH